MVKDGGFVYVYVSGGVFIAQIPPWLSVSSLFSSSSFWVLLSLLSLSYFVFLIVLRKSTNSHLGFSFSHMGFLDLFIFLIKFSGLIIQFWRVQILASFILWVRIYLRDDWWCVIAWRWYIRASAIDEGKYCSLKCRRSKSQCLSNSEYWLYWLQH